MFELLTAGTPKSVSADFNVVSYDGSVENVAFVNDQGDLYFLGNNATGNMGKGDTVSPTGWYKSEMTGVQDVWQNGSRITVIRKTDGTVWYCGRIQNRYQMGVDYGSITIVPTWQEITSAMPVPVSDIKYIKCGYSSTLILTNSGDIYWCGVNQGGHFGNNATATLQSFTKTENSFAIVEAYVCPQFSPTPAQSSFIQDASGYVYGAGNNTYALISSSTSTTYPVYTQISTTMTFGKLILGTQKWMAIGTLVSSGVRSLRYSGYPAAIGSSSSSYLFNSIITTEPTTRTLVDFSLTQDGSSSTAGATIYGSVINSTGVISVVSAGASNQTNVTNSNTLAGYVAKSFPPAGELETNTNFTFVSTATRNMGLLYHDEGGYRLYGVGPIFGQAANLLGAPFVRYTWPVVTPPPVPAPTISKMVSAGSSGTEALGILMSDGSFYTRGRAANGKLGNGSTTDDIFSSWYKAATDVTDVWGGGNTFLFKKATGYTTFGSGAPFGLTTDNLTETALPTAITSVIDMSKVTKICMSVESALFLGGSAGNTVYGTGTNTNGSLGTTTTNLTSPRSVGVNMIAMSMSAATAYMINIGGRLFTSGDNTYNQLGDGTTTTRKTLEELLVNGQSGIVSSVVAGLTGAHILTTDGTVYGVGAYIYGQGGVRLTTPTALTLPTSANGYSLTLPPLGNTAAVVNNGDKTAYYGKSSLGNYYGLPTNTSGDYVAFGTSFDHTKTTGFIQLSNSSWFLNDGKLYHAGNQTITDTYNSTVVDATYTQVVGP